MNEEAVRILYTNHQGETETRLIVPRHLWFGVTEHHKTSQHLLDAYDVERKVMRTFAMVDIHQWVPATAQPKRITLRVALHADTPEALVLAHDDMSNTFYEDHRQAVADGTGFGWSMFAYEDKDKACLVEIDRRRMEA